MLYYFYNSSLKNELTFHLLHPVPTKVLSDTESFRLKVSLVGG